MQAFERSCNLPPSTFWQFSIEAHATVLHCSFAAIVVGVSSVVEIDSLPKFIQFVTLVKKDTESTERQCQMQG